MEVMEEVDAVLRALEARGLGARTHAGRALRAHLFGTARLLDAWGCARAVVLAGACHSVYGTQAYAHATLGAADRSWLRGLIGEEAERLAWIFGRHVQDSLWDNVTADGSPVADRAPRVEDHFTKAAIALVAEDLPALFALAAANWVEQFPRLPAAVRDGGRPLFARVRGFVPEPGWRALDGCYGFSAGGAD